VRRTVQAVLAAVVSAGAAYAVVSSLVGSGSGSPPSPGAAASPGQPAWLGVETDSFATAVGGAPPGGGVVVTKVVPGSPAAAAGLAPGDLITQIDNRPIASTNDVNSALAGMHAGQQMQIQYQRGPFTEIAQVTLAARPSGYP
jgi:S1-C subfamily serine protease